MWLFILLLLQAATPVQRDFDVLEVGSFHGEEVKAIDRSRWLALIERDGRFALEETQIRVNIVKDELLDAEQEKMTGKEVAVEGEGTVLFLISARQRLSTGPVVTVPLPQADELSPTRYALRLASSDYVLEATKLDANKMLTKGSEIVLARGEVRQVLYSLNGKEEPDEPHWRLVWAGDLDGDGKLDLYLHASYHYNLSQGRLFLSSGAENGKLVREVALFETTGC